MKAVIAITWLALIAMFVFVQTKFSGDEDHFELSIPMGRMQAFMDKLYFSGKNENWELASFYLHELEEQAEEIVHADVIEDDFQASDLRESLFIPQIESLKATVSAKSGNAFLREYDTLVSRCNKCHVATNHGFLRITTPTRSMFENQDYSKSTEVQQVDKPKP